MSQLLACVVDDHVLVASDRRVEVRHEGETTAHSLRKLFALGGKAAVATGGAAEGIRISRSLAQATADISSMDFPELEGYVMATFQREYDEFKRKGEEWFRCHPEALTLSYVLLAGVDNQGAPHLRFYASERHNEPYRALPITKVVSAPRRLGLEAKLSMEVLCAHSPGAVRAKAIEHLARIERADPAVGGPFDLALIGPTGITMEIFEEIDQKC